MLYSSHCFFWGTQEDHIHLLPVQSVGLVPGLALENIPHDLCPSKKEDLIVLSPCVFPTPAEHTAHLYR